eukprot:443263-Heterocapsa_arctica.AAC.1
MGAGAGLRAIGCPRGEAFSDPFTLLSDPFTPFGSEFVENDQRCVGHLMAIARGLPHTPVPRK